MAGGGEGGTGLAVRVLGPVEADVDGRPVELGGPAQRAVLAWLALEAGRVVPVERLVDRLWGEEPPPSAVGTLQGLVSRLRRVLEPGRAPGTPSAVVVSEAPGYRLAVPRTRVDAFAADDLLARGRAALDADPATALAHLDAALALWRGDALAGVPSTPSGDAVVRRLTDLRAQAAEDRFAALLALGRHAEAVPALHEAVAADPFRERLHELLALALYRGGRQAEALAALTQARRVLVDELGLDPGPRLRELSDRVLAQDPALLEVPPPAASPPAPVRPSADARAPEAAAPAGPTPVGPELVGRDEERAVLADVVAAGGAVLVEGEAGIGKSSLVADAADRARAAGRPVAVGRFLEDGLAPVLWGWVEVVRALATGPLPGVLAGFAASGAEGTAPSSGASPVEQADAIAGVLAAAGRPVVVLEDLHWADAASLALLPLVAARLAGGTLLVTTRPAHDAPPDAASAAARLLRVPGARLVGLAGLDAAEVARLWAGTGAPAPDDAGAHRLQARTGGNPLFVVELARLATSPGAARLGRQGGEEVPAAVRDVVRRRLAPLPDATRAALLAAAVLGEEADLRVLAHVADRSPDACLDDLDPAVVAGLLHPVPGGVRFGHALVREAVLADTTGLGRARLHARAADAVEAVLGADRDRCEPIAAHRWAAAAVEDPARLCAALLRAGRAVTRVGALDRGDELFDRALDVAARMPVGATRADLEAQAVEGVMGVETVRSFNGERGGMERRVEAVVARNPTPATRAFLAFIRWSAVNVDGPLAVVDHAVALRDLGAGTDSPYVRVLADYTWGTQLWLTGRAQQACEVLDRGWAVRAEALAHDPPVRLPTIALGGISAMAHEAAGDPDGADDRLVAVRAAHEEDGERQSAIDLAFFGGLVHALRRDPDGARAVTTPVVAGDGVRLAHFSPSVDVVHGWATALGGDPGGGAARALRGLAEIDAGATTVGVSAVRTLAAEAVLLDGRPEEAAALVERAREQALALGERWWLAETLRVLADVRSVLGEDPGPVLEEAARIAAEQGQPVLLDRVRAQASAAR